MASDARLVGGSGAASRPAGGKWAAAAVLLLTPLLAWLAFPPARAPELAFVFAVPALWWAMGAPSWRRFAATLVVAWSLAWAVLIAWLHHVTVGGLAALAFFLGGFTTAWFLAARWALSRAVRAGAGTKVMTVAGLAALWVVGEWVRSWLFTGFPWLTLAATQWQRPVMLALCPHVGAYGVSFLLMLVNLGVTAFLVRLSTARYDEPRRWFTPELIFALAALLAGTFGLSRDLLGQRRVPWLRVGIVQPYIPQSLKWDPLAAQENLRILERETAAVGARQPDLVLWPESAVPYILKVQPQLQGWFETQARSAGAPLLSGVVVMEDADQPTERWYNGAVVVDPDRGLQSQYYVKRHLVPFGEYVPLGCALAWMKKFVPIGDDFLPGQSAAPLVVSTRSRPVAAGVLVCYEDVFPGLARESAAAGAELLVNVTNNAWYGEGAAAYQHAAHSALRAAETRRPLVRCGNGGWSGWFDEFGTRREVLTDARGSVYYRGGAVVTLTRDERWIGRSTPYVAHGDWFVAACAALAALAAVRLRRGNN